jgi:hypothetical protein
LRPNTSPPFAHRTIYCAPDPSATLVLADAHAGPARRLLPSPPITASPLAHTTCGLRQLLLALDALANPSRTPTTLQTMLRFLSALLLALLCATARQSSRSFPSLFVVRSLDEEPRSPCGGLSSCAGEIPLLSPSLLSRASSLCSPGRAASGRVRSAWSFEASARNPYACPFWRVWTCCILRGAAHRVVLAPAVLPLLVARPLRGPASRDRLSPPLATVLFPLAPASRQPLIDEARPRRAPSGPLIPCSSLDPRATR